MYYNKQSYIQFDGHISYNTPVKRWIARNVYLVYERQFFDIFEKLELLDDN